MEVDGKVVVEVWSDVMCPFCYIGKRRFEKALEEQGMEDDVVIIWKSFQLNPNAVTNPEVSVTKDLAEKKGWSIEYTHKMQDHVTKMAEDEGLAYDFDNAVVANSFNAHRLLQYAKTQGKGDELKESLLRSYFTEGLNTDDDSTLILLGEGVGLPSGDVKSVVGDKTAYSDEVRKDLAEASSLGIHAVPTFVFNRTFLVSGAQSVGVFKKALKKAQEK